MKGVSAYLVSWKKYWHPHQPNKLPLPRRYTQALSNLTQNLNIISSPTDKSGGAVIMHKQRYINKINSFLKIWTPMRVSNLTPSTKILPPPTNFSKNSKNHKPGHPSSNTTLQSQHYMAYPKFTNQTPPWPIISSISRATNKIAHTIAKILTINHLIWHN